MDGPEEGVEGHVADVLVVVEEEPAEDVDGQHAEAGLGVDVHDRDDSLVEDGVANVLARLGVGGHLVGILWARLE